MAEYGYTYQSISTFNTSGVRNETRGPVISPFVPFVPKANGNGNSEGYVTKKKIVPVASGPYGDEAYHGRDDDEWNHQQTSPVRGSPRTIDEFLTKVQNEASRPARSSTVTSPDHWRHSPQPTPYDGANGYRDYRSNKPIGGTIRNDNHDGYNGTSYGYGKPTGSTVKNDNHDGYNGTNGYGDYGRNKEGHKPTGSTIRNDKYDGYNGTNGYGDYGSNKEGRKPIGGTIRNENHDGYNNGTNYGYGKPIGGTIKNDSHDGYNGTNGYGEYGNNKEGRKPTGTTIRNENHDGYNGTNGDRGNYGNKEGRKVIGSPVKNDKYDGYKYNGPNGYGGYEELDYNKEGHKPTGSPIRNGYNNGYGGYGIGNGNDKEKGKPFGIGSPTGNGKYDHDDDYGNYYNNKEGHKPPGSGGGPKMSSAWTAAPRKGTQLSEPTHDIGKAMELLKNEAAKLNVNGHSNNGRHKPYEYDGSTPSMNRAAPLTSKFDKGMDLVNETERLKNIVTGAPQSRSSVPNKDDTRPYANSNLSSSRPRFPFIDGRGPDYRDDTRRGYGTIDHREAKKRFDGMTI